MRTAAYCRYSSDQQSATSLADQLRNVRAYCSRMGWPEPAVYQDAAISGARNDRPGYLKLLAEAERFEVILVDDLTRLSRDSVEAQQQVRRLTFKGVRVIGVSDGVDTGRKGHKADVALRGLMGELYLADLADKTHRGLTGRALEGASAGGLPFGYRVTETGQRAVREDQAAIVRRIYADYIAGYSPREIASALNRDGVPAPRGAQWAASAIRPDVKRDLGILANPIYFGRQIWNRTRWVKHPDTGRRVPQRRPESEWLTTDHAELAIIDAATWKAAQARHQSRSRATGANSGRPPTHLLSGILRCGDCGAPMVIVDRYRYGCSHAKERGTCSSKVKVVRKTAEDAMLAGVREQLLTEENIRRVQKVAAKLRQAQPEAEITKAALAQAERERSNVMEAIKAGIITPSTKAALQSAERDIARLQSELTQSAAPATMIPQLRERFRKLADSLSDVARRKPEAREAMRALIGSATVRNSKGALVAEIAPSCALALVAGAGSALYLTEPLSIPLTSKV